MSGMNEQALIDYLYRATSSSSEDAAHKEEMLCCAPEKGDLKKELTADNSAVVEEKVCKAEEVPDGTKKEVELRGRKILIINDGGKYMAINGLCSHYNWPLVTGYYYKGRVRCPLHGACFNTETGDIEDYPGFDSLHPFQVKKVGTDLVIKTTEKRLESDRRTRKSWLKQTTNEKPIVVVGSGPAGQSVLENLRLAGCKQPIIQFTKESMPAYDRVLLSKKMDIDAVRLRPDEYYLDNHISVRLNSKVVAFDAAAHTVTLSDKSSYVYDKLILALGGAVRTLSNKGSDLKGVFTLRNHDDPKKIMEATKGKDLVCVGASFIGMETASSMKAVANSVTVICSTNEPVPALGIDVGRALRKYFDTKGVRVITDARVDHLEGGGDGHVKEVVLKDGTRLPASCVVAGVGVDPDTTWLKNHNVALDERGFIKVNDKFATSIPDVYAIGDAISAPLPFWGIDTINIQHFQVAQRHGQLAAWSILGKPQPGKLIPYFWTLFFFEKGIKFAGCSEGYDEIYTKGDVDSLEFVKYYLKNNQVIAVSSGGPAGASIQFLALCEQGKHISREDVEKNSTDDWAFMLK
ncbi:hypothetical protein PRIPAC_96250 [Pristionchus pacificus]|uniref:Pyridine nucleotide-disulfide oxidoreductase n=1 Tax=Pristionchus pacificus TaxID=54126 RepID=A0A2A6BJZ9_PRIPA|nr:hypothetical protein PRIPAC_96250 [Pristionchus pacificus]|eukprot:PDM66240.1 pyridine nucleotide-disulfide oxidoreductase [Pristionchus pacificus]